MRKSGNIICLCFVSYVLINSSRISDRILDGCICLRSVKALLDAILTPQLCVRALCAQIDLNFCDGLNRGLHPHPLMGLGVHSFLSYTSAVLTWVPGAPGPGSELACYRVLPDDPWTINRPRCNNHPALLTCLWRSGAAPRWWAHCSARRGVPSAPGSPALREQCHPCSSLMLCFWVQSTWKCRFILEEQSCPLRLLLVGFYKATFIFAFQRKFRYSVQ